MSIKNGIYTAREHQTRTVKKVMDYIDSPSTKKVVVVEPTASGKSLIMAMIASNVTGSVLSVQPSITLLRQNLEKFQAVSSEEAVTYSASAGSKELGHITFCTPGSIKKEVAYLKKYPPSLVLIDECFPFHTPIATNKGSMYIGDICNAITEGEDILVKSFNEHTSAFEYKKVIGAKNNGKRNLVSVNLGKTNILCTDRHKLLTTDGWKSATELHEGEAVVTSYDSQNISSYAQLNEDQFDLMVGSGLGDGSIEFRNKESTIGRIRITHGEKQGNYLKHKASIIGYKDKVSYVEKNGFAQTPAYRLSGPTVYLKEGLRSYSEQIDSLNSKSLAILWQDDGHLSKLQNSGSLYSMCHSEELITKLHRKLTMLGVTDITIKLTKSSSTGNSVWYIRFRKKGLQQISKIVAPYVHIDLKYKIVDSEKSKVGSYIWDNKFLPSVRLVKEVVSTNKYEEVFDIEVEDNHNFVVVPKSVHVLLNSKSNSSKATNDGIVVHNCHLSSKHNSDIGKLLKEIGAKKVVGFTASPLVLKPVKWEGSVLTMLNRSSKNIFNDIISVTQIKELISKDYWSPLIYDIRQTDTSKLMLNTTGNDYTQASVSNHYRLNNLHTKISETVKELFAEGRESILIFVDSIHNAELLQTQIEGSEVMHSKLPTKEELRIEKGFKSSHIKVVIVIGKWVVGFDKPNLSAAIMARPTNSWNIYYQQIGRLIRIHDGKKDAKLVDFSGNVERFGRVEGVEFLEVNGKWGMYNNGIAMTVNAEPYPPMKRNDLFTFGKYLGIPITEVPREYLIAFVGEYKKEDELKKKIVECLGE